MKEIEKVVQKLSRGQEAAAGGGGAGGGGGNRYKNIKLPPVYRGDLIRLLHSSSLVAIGLSIGYETWLTSRFCDWLFYI